MNEFQHLDLVQCQDLGRIFTQIKGLDLDKLEQVTFAAIGRNRELRLALAKAVIESSEVLEALNRANNTIAALQAELTEYRDRASVQSFKIGE
jgi:1-deoxy-D-xylulose 5-phosphate reductoisomerase